METQLAILAATAPDGHWRIGIENSTFAGWFAVAVYFVSAALCARAAWVEGHPGSRPDPSPSLPVGRRSAAARQRAVAAWWILAAVLLMLGITRQFDLQAALTERGRSLAKAQNWYETRREFQRAFIVSVALGGIVALAGFGWYFRHLSVRHRLAMAGLCVLLSFVTIRAVSLHSVDALIGRRLLGLKWNWILELGAISIIAAAAAAQIRSSGRPAPIDPIDDHQGPRTYRISGH